MPLTSYVIFLTAGVAVLVPTRIVSVREVRAVRRTQREPRTWILVIGLLGTMFGGVGILVGVIGVLSVAKHDERLSSVSAAILLVLAASVGVSTFMRERRLARRRGRPIRRVPLVLVCGLSGAAVLISVISWFL